MRAGANANRPTGERSAWTTVWVNGKGKYNNFSHAILSTTNSTILFEVILG